MEREHTAASALDALPWPVFSIEETQLVVVAENQAARVHSAHQRDASESRCYRLLYARDTPCPYCPAGEALKRPAEKIIQHRISGEERHFRVTFVRAIDGQLIEALEDITQQQEKQEENMRLENLAALGIMISGIAHELNNPLTGMNLTLQNLEANISSLTAEQTGTKLASLRKDLQRASRIVSDVLSFSSPGRPRKARADIIQTIRKAIETTRRLYPVLSRQIDWELAHEEEQEFFQFDPEKMERVFINLFRNAVQAFDYAEGRIKVEVHRHRRFMRIMVEDNAGGIPEEMRKRIFHPFYKSPNGRGSGLGLTICHSIVREHHGRIHVRSVGRESRFYISLPVASDNET